MGALRKTAILTGLAFGLFVFVNNTNQAAALSGNDFRAGRIIDTDAFFDGNALTINDIQYFLNSKVPVCDTNGTQPRGNTTRAAYGSSVGNPPPYVCLKDFRQDTPGKGAEAGLCNAYGGGNKSAAEIIYSVGQACGVSQKVLLVLLQKEQSLVTDDWPWPLQYRSATGYGCPDTAPCDSEYYGFFNQVYNAARQYKRYVKDANMFNFRAGKSSFVQYNPASSCNGTNIVMENGATAGLYNYTPYQPNQAALNNLYGSGDGCSAYGNRNFWRMYNDWFGSGWRDVYTLAISDDGNPTQYVIYSGVKQAIPSPAIKTAWGLDSVTPVEFPTSYLSSITTGPPLDRLMRLNDEQTVYFLDGGKRYRIPWDVMIDTWNLRGKVVSRVSRGLFNVPIDGGNLTYALRNTGSSTIYMPDGADGQGRTVLRAYSNIDVYRAWEGVDAGYVTVSMDYFGDIDDAVGAPLTGTKVICGGTEYQIVNGYRLWQTAAVSPLFPGTAQPVSWPTIGRMSVGPNVTQVIKSPTSPVYVVDSSTRHPLLTNEALNAWSTPTQDITYVNNGFLNLIAQGSNVSGYMADSGGQLYLVNRRKIPVPASLDTAYRNSGAVLSASSSLMALYPSMSPATSFIKSNDSPAVYLMDDSGHRRPIPSSNVITAWGEQPTPTELSFYVVNDITAGSAVGMYATSGGVNYLIDDGKKWTVSASVATDWGLSSPQSFADTTLNRLPTAGALPTKVKTAEGLYYLVSKGKAYFTVNTAVAGIWNLKSAATVSSRLVPILLGNADLLHRFVRSDQQGDSRKFMVESGNWYTVNDTQIANIGGSTPGINTLDPAIAPNTITAWGSVIIKAGDGTHFAMDGGTKHQFTNSTIQNQWTNSGSLTVPTVGNDFLDLMATASAMQKSIKGGGPGIFKGENGTKRLITSSATYNAQFAPYLSVSEAMINSLPNGSDIN